MLQHPFIPFAVWYTGGRARATLVHPPTAESPRAWRTDLEAIRASGFNAVRCWINWASGEPAPGDYHFEALDLLLDLAQSVGLRVIVQLYLDSAPDWLAHHFPDSRYLSAGGQAIDSQGAPGYCYDHPGVRAAAERFMGALAAHIAPHPAFHAWDLWSEPHIVQWGYFDFLPQPAIFCYCHHTVQRFRGWLRTRYRDLAALNAVWDRCFTSWDTVLAPKFISLMSYTDYLDWLQFLMDKLAEDLRWRHEVVRRVDHHLTTSHSALPSVLTLPISEQGSPDDWRMARSVDIWGASLYPKHVGAAESNDPAFRAATLAAARSPCAANGAPFWLGEVQGGHGYVGAFATEMSAADARAYAWQAISHGAKGLSFYAWYPMSRGYESAGFGLANLDGTPSPRAEAAGAVARTVGAQMALFAAATPRRAEAAICWNVYARMMWVCLRQRSSLIPSRSLIGAYKALFAAHLPADFIHIDDIVAERVAGYRFLHLPFGLALPRAASPALGRFVAGGGVLLAEARTGWNDEAGACGEAVPGFGLAALFGCRERGVESVADGAVVRVRLVCDHPTLPTLRAGSWLCGAVFRQALEPTSPAAVVLGEFEDGSPAIVAHPHGSGWAILVGTLLSLGSYRSDDVASRAFLQGVATFAGVTPPVTVSGEGAASIEVSLLDSGPAALLVVFNHGREAATPILGLALAPGAYRATDIESGESLPLCPERERPTLAPPLAPGAVRLFHIEPLAG